MGKKDYKDNKDKQRVEAVLELLRKQAPLTVKQEKFCNTACVERFLKTKGDNVKKATKHLRSCLSWRDTTGIEHLIADEFSNEISEGSAYVAGHDEESRPVMVFRIKQDYQNKLYVRLLVFTLEVAIASMPRNVEQFVVLFDASFFRSASAFMNVLMVSLKTVSDYYPGRLYMAFIIDPPSLFSCLWKGVRRFVELSTVIMVVSSLDLDESREYDDFSSFPRSSSLRFDPSSTPTTAKIGPSSSSRFSFTTSPRCDSLKPWYLSLTDTSASKVGPNNIPSSPYLMGSALISPLNSRSFSFASPAARSPHGSINNRGGPTRKSNIFPSTPLPQKTTNNMNQPRTPRPSFLQSPALFFKRDYQVSRTDKTRESFRPFLRFYRIPYDEMVYRSKMRPPLGGLISIISPRLKRRHVSASKRYL